MKSRITALVITILTLSCLFSACKNHEPLKPAELLALGEKYLQELDYEEAVVHFLKVIEIEPMNPRGYTGAADAYIALGKNDEAIAVLQRGLLMNPEDPSVKKMLEELDKLLEPEIKLEQEPEASQTDVLLATEHKQLLIDLLEKFQSSDMQAVADYISAHGHQDEQKGTGNNELENIRKQIGTDAGLLGFDGENFRLGLTGKGLVIAGRDCFYYGELVDGTPNGNGVVFRPHTFYQGGAIAGSWCEGVWIDGRQESAVITDVYSSNYGANNDFPECGLLIECQYAEDDIMKEADVIVFIREDEEHRYSYQVANGQVLWEHWTPAPYNNGEVELVCQTHGGACGKNLYADPSVEVCYQNLTGWYRKNVSNTMEHYRNYGVGIGWSG